jgi:tetratricopeptide (TPR) repeat protein
LARSLVHLCLAVLCAAGACLQFRAGMADALAQPHTPEAFRNALQYAPDDPAMWRQLGIALVRANADGARAAFERAVELDRFDADSLVGLGFESERLGRFADAERFYVRASESSRRFRPKYALAGFYLRTGRPERFWPVAAQAVNIPPANITPLFRLAHGTGTRPDDIAARLQLGTNAARAAWVAFALHENEPDSAAAVAMHLPAEERYQPVLLQTCERLIQRGNTNAALALWNRLPDVEKLDPAGGRSLGGPGFCEPRTHGFHWRSTGLAGTATRVLAGPALQIEFSGDQPERGAVLQKTAPVLPGRKYRLAVAYSTSDLQDPTGLTWTVAPLAGAGVPVTSVALRAAEDGAATAEFISPPDCTLLRIALNYARATGTVRITGSIRLLSASLELLQ